MSEDWSFWRDALAGGTPETSPGTPMQGYYLSRRRTTYRDPIVGKRRNRVEVTFNPVAIWHDENGWHCLTHANGQQFYIQDIEKIDELFSYCCRSPITYENYLELTAEKETVE